MSQALYFEVVPMTCPECEREIAHAWSAGSGKLRCPLCATVFEDSRVEAVKRRAVSLEDMQRAIKEYREKWRAKLHDQISEIPEFGIRVVVCVDDDGQAHGGSIKSDLLKDAGDDDDNEPYISAVNAIESMILSHAMAGIKVDFPEYVDGIRTVVETIVNRYA